MSLLRYASDPLPYGVKHYGINAKEKQTGGGEMGFDHPTRLHKVLIFLLAHQAAVLFVKNHAFKSSYLAVSSKRTRELPLSQLHLNVKSFLYSTYVI